MSFRTKSFKFRDKLESKNSRWLFFLIVCGIVLFSFLLMMWRSGNWLVHQDTYNHANWAVVLSGQSRECERTDRALSLHKLREIDTLLISSMRIFKNHYEDELLIPELVQNGYDSSKLFVLRHNAHSTMEEAIWIIKQLRLLRLDTVLIITSNFHTARSRRIFNKLSKGSPWFIIDAANHLYFNPKAWWTNREGLKCFFYEYVKTVATFFELKFHSKSTIPTQLPKLIITPKAPLQKAYFSHHSSDQTVSDPTIDTNGTTIDTSITPN